MNSIPSSGRLEPDDSTPMVSDRPVLIVPRTVWFCARLFAPIVRAWQERRTSKCESRVHKLVTNAARCRNRTQLESLLGKPRYSLKGDRFKSIAKSGKVTTPDRVECYYVKRCRIEIWFRDGRAVRVTGSVAPNVWTAALAYLRQGVQEM